MALKEFNQGLLIFLENSPTPYHAAANLALMLGKAGYETLREDDQWSLKPGGRYYLIRNDSSLIAFNYGDSEHVETAIRLVGAHTDSPTLMVKPQPEKAKKYFQLGVEVYGGALLNPWFDRDLSMAGRVVFRDKQSGQLDKRLINFGRPIATIPSLAIHLDREANRKRSINAQTDIVPILFEATANSGHDFREILTRQLSTEHGELKDVSVVDYELCFYDSQRPAQIGLYGGFIASARLDNLLSCYSGAQALIESSGSQTSMLVCNDHEEVGSARFFYKLRIGL